MNPKDARTTRDLEALHALKDTRGHRRIETDTAFRKEVREATRRIVGPGDHIEITGTQRTR